MDKLWFKFSEEVILKFNIFFKNLQNIQRSIQKMDMYSLCQDIMLSQKHAIYILLI